MTFPSSPIPAASHGQPPAPSTLPIARQLSPIAVYLLCVGSFGAFAPLWIYRAARWLDRKPSHKRKHLAWSLSSFIPPIGCLVLFELTRLATARTPPLARFDFLTPALVLWSAIALAVGLLSPPLDQLWGLKLLLLPIPLALSQATLRRAAASANTERTGAPSAVTSRWAHLAIAIVGLLGVALAIQIDSKAWQRVLAERYAAGAHLGGASNRYRLTIPQAGSWRKVPAGTFGDSDSDLELERIDGTSWLVAYTQRYPALDLDGYVAARMAVVEQSTGGLKAFEERRYFLDADEFVVGSLARYDVGRGASASTFWVLTTIASSTGYELVTQTTRTQHEQQALAALLASFEVVADRGQP